MICAAPHLPDLHQHHLHAGYGDAVDTTRPPDTRGDDMITKPSPYVAAIAAEWRAVHVEPGQYDPETDSVIDPGWYLVATDADEPESVLVELKLQFAVDEHGSVCEEDVARSLVGLLRGNETARAMDVGGSETGGNFGGSETDS